MLGQVAQQASDTAQAAVSQATAVQAQPANVAAPVVLGSAGATAVVEQANTAAAGAAAQNASSTSQRADQSRQGGRGSAAPAARDEAQAEPSGGAAGAGPSQATRQASRTAQDAAAQATTVQVQPVNVAVPVLIQSPRSRVVIVQTNTASSGAAAVNESTTTQASGQAAAAPALTGAAAPGPRLATGGSAQAAPALDGAPGGAPAAVVIATGTDWTWIWNWTIDLRVPGLRTPAFPAWALPWDERRQATQARGTVTAPSPARPVDPRRAVAARSPAPESATASPLPARRASSSIVQRPPAVPAAALEPFVQLPRPPLPAPSAGSGFVPAGLLVGALVTLALYLGSLGLLFGRLSLASAPWRHQAYLTPPQRPG